MYRRYHARDCLAAIGVLHLHFAGPTQLYCFALRGAVSTLCGKLRVILSIMLTNFDFKFNYITMMTYHERKAERTAQFYRNAGLRLIECTACAGSGRYDHNGSPNCGCCNGTGRMREVSASSALPAPHWREQLKRRETVRRMRSTA